MIRLISTRPIDNLPTWDPESLALQMYLHCCGQVEYEVCGPEGTAVTRIPAILHGSTFVSGFNDCVKYLNVTLDIDLDAELTAPQRALSMAVEALVSDSLYDALLLHWFGNVDNRRIVERNIGKSLSYLQRVRHLWSGQISDSVACRLNRRYTDIEFDERRLELKSKGSRIDTTRQTFEKARETYAALTTLLGDKETFFGTPLPTRLDVVVFAHLSVHSMYALPNPTLSEMIAFEFTALNKFMHKVSAKWLPSHDSAPWTRHRFDEKLTWTQYMQGFMPASFSATGVQWGQSGVEEDDSKTWRQVADIYLPVVGAAALFSFYVVKRGIVRFEVADDHHLEEEEEDQGE